MVRLLANPLLLRALLVFFAAAGAFVIGIALMRRMRETIAAEAEFDAVAPKLDNLPLHLYHTVIQQLKQQKQELQVQNQAEQHRARTTETFSQAVLSNLSSGVLVFGENGLVKQANPAAKQILGFSSPSGMSAQDIFRTAASSTEGATPYADGLDADALNSDALGGFQGLVSDEVNAVLREGSKCRQIEADYATPAGEKLRIAVTVSPVPAVDGGLLGVACLISDRTELKRIRQQQQLQGEISAEMALELRTSLTTISGYAQQLARNHDPLVAPRLAADIAGEAARLDRHIGGFLVAKHQVSTLAKGASAGH